MPRHSCCFCLSVFSLLLPSPGRAGDAGAVQGSVTLPGAGDDRFREKMLAWDAAAGTAPASPAYGAPTLSAAPVRAWKVSSSFGMRRHPLDGHVAMHSGLDLPARYGSPVYAPADGRVDRARGSGGYGKLVELDHGDGVVTRYGHLSRLLVAEGAAVRQGALIGLIGSTGRSTGNHLHYEVRVNGRAVDPLPYLQADSVVPVPRPEETGPFISAFARSRTERTQSGRLP
jgi:murein DD-endopeptidase MepM/ murein hydrolase activator NlpD